MSGDSSFHQMAQWQRLLVYHGRLSVPKRFTRLARGFPWDGMIKQGVVMWMEGPARTLHGREHPLIYWVGFDAVYPTDIELNADRGR